MGQYRKLCTLFLDIYDIVLILSEAKDLQLARSPANPTVSGNGATHQLAPPAHLPGWQIPQLVAWGSIFSFDPVLHSVIGFTVRTSWSRCFQLPRM